MKTRNSLKEIAEVLKNAASVLMVTHVHPDADGQGCQAAMAAVFTQLGIFFAIDNQDVSEKRHQLLRISDFRPDAGFKADVALVMDVPVRDRLGDRLEKVLACPTVINIDHHLSNEDYGHLNYVDVTAASTGNIIFDLISEMGVALNADMATGLYAAMVDDTACFRHSNTTADTLRHASVLLQHGARSQDIIHSFYNSRPVSEVRIRSKVMSNMELLSGGLAAMAWVSQSMLGEYGASKEDTSNLSEELRSVEGVEAAAFLSELENGKIRVSLRSKSSVDMNQLAGKFGGGGHVRASGATLEGPLESACSSIRSALLEALKGL